MFQRPCHYKKQHKFRLNYMNMYYIFILMNGLGVRKGSQKKPNMVFKPYLVYSGCQKDVPFVERIFLQPLIPPFRISALIFEKRYK